MPDLMLGAVIIGVGVLAVGLIALMAVFWPATFQALKGKKGHRWYAKRIDSDE